MNFAFRSKYSNRTFSLSKWSHCTKLPSESKGVIFLWGPRPLRGIMFCIFTAFWYRPPMEKYFAIYAYGVYDDYTLASHRSLYSEVCDHLCYFSSIIPLLISIQLALIFKLSDHRSDTLSIYS